METEPDPNWPTIARMTLLTTVILEGHNEATKYIVEQGADINFKGHDERSPAFYAVEYINRVALEFLYQKGADFTSSSIAHPTIAGIATQHADIRTLHMLTSFNLMLVDVDCIDSEGLSIPQVFERRIERGLTVEADFFETFNIFLGILRRNRTV